MSSWPESPKGRDELEKTAAKTIVMMPSRTGSHRREKAGRSKAAFRVNGKEGSPGALILKGST